MSKSRVHREMQSPLPLGERLGEGYPVPGPNARSNLEVRASHERRRHRAGVQGPKILYGL
jgi:hypothetical protein